VLALGAASPALAQDANTTAAGTAVGGAAGAATGGTIGFFLGGPIGAVIGGFAGAAIGAGAVSSATVDYAANNPVDPVYIDDNIDVGYTVGPDVHVYPVEGDAAHGYFYANNRVYIVDMDSGKVVHSPGYVIPQSTVAYVEAHPSADVQFSGDIAPGAHISADFSMNAIPDNPDYSYAYVDGRPVLIDNRSDIVVWTE
jgi:hypothetical protein